MPHLQSTTRRLPTGRMHKLMHPTRGASTALAPTTQRGAMLLGVTIASAFALDEMADHLVSVWFDRSIDVPLLLFFGLLVGVILLLPETPLSAESKRRLAAVQRRLETTSRALCEEVARRRGAPVDVDGFDATPGRAWLLRDHEGRRAVVLDCASDGVVVLRGPLLEQHLGDGPLPGRWRIERLRSTGKILTLSCFGAPVTTASAIVEDDALARVDEVSSLARAQLPATLAAALGEGHRGYRG